MSRKVIIIDFDETLVDTAEIKRRLFGVAKKFGISRAQAEKAYKNLRKKHHFEPERYVQALRKYNKKVYWKEFEKIFAKPKEYNYKGAENFLKNLARNNKLILLSYADPIYQKKKIKQSGLGKYFDRIILTTQLSKQKELKKLKNQFGKKLVLLDDKTISVKSAAGLGIRAIKIKKGIKTGRDFTKLLDLVDKIRQVSWRI